MDVRRYMLVALVLLLAGCASKEWKHMNPALHNDETFARDQADCVQQARALVGEPNGEPGTPEYGVWRIQFNSEFEQCMESRGWRKE